MISYPAGNEDVLLYRQGAVEVDAATEGDRTPCSCSTMNTHTVVLKGPSVAATLLTGHKALMGKSAEATKAT